MDPPFLYGFKKILDGVGDRGLFWRLFWSRIYATVPETVKLGQGAGDGVPVLAVLPAVHGDYHGSGGAVYIPAGICHKICGDPIALFKFPFSGVVINRDPGGNGETQTLSASGNGRNLSLFFIFSAPF